MCALFYRPCSLISPLSSCTVFSRYGFPSVPRNSRRGHILRLRASSSDVTPSEEPKQEPTLVESRTDSVTFPRDNCLIESRHSVSDFAELQQEELKAQVESRRNKVFLLLEEIRRLRIQLQLRSRSTDNSNGEESEEYESVVPILNRSHFVRDKNMKQYIAIYIWVVIGVILFGGLVAPSLEVRMGLGGTSYLEFIQSLQLPEQLAEVDPIVASFCGGAVGALSTSLVIDLNNIKNQQRNRCYYCKGAGYLPCGSCVGSGVERDAECAACSGTGKVMCPNCFCTGKHLVTEHDPRIDPFD